MDAAVSWIEKRNVLISKGMDEYTQAGKLRSRGINFAPGCQSPQVLELSAGYSWNELIERDPFTSEYASLRGKQIELAPRHSANALLSRHFNSSINQWALKRQVTPGTGHELPCTSRLQL